MGVLSRFCSNLGPVNVELVKHLLWYLSGTLYLGLKFDGKADTPDDLVGYKDSDFAGSKTYQKLTRRYVFILAECAINHSSKLQSIIVLLIYEAEYIAICKAKKKVVWLGYLLKELEVRRPDPIQLKQKIKSLLRWLAMKNSIAV